MTTQNDNAKQDNRKNAENVNTDKQNEGSNVKLNHLKGNPNENSFVTHHNPLYDDDYVVVQAKEKMNGNPKNLFGAKATYMSVNKEKVNDDNAPILDAHQLALNKLNLNSSKDVSVKQHNLDELNGPPGSSILMYNRYLSDLQTPGPSAPKDNSDDGFVKGIGKKKKRKTYE